MTRLIHKARDDRAGSSPEARAVDDRLVHETPIRVGDLVGDKYRIEGVIATGGMGVIVRARHQTLNQIVAIKLLRGGSMSEELIRRFLREARAAASIDSDHVAKVFDCGSESGVPYMVIEHLEGRDLRHELAERGALEVSEAVDVLAQALEGLASAHALGIVHRDLKPANLFLVARPGAQRHVKVLDFGISKTTSTAADDDLTTTEHILGSPRYMAPEQARESKSVDARADIWSLGVIFYEMLTGERLFRGTTVAAMVSSILFDPLTELDERDTLPKALRPVLKRCLARDVDQRYASVADLATALLPFASERGRLSLERVKKLGPDEASFSRVAIHAVDVARSAPARRKGGRRATVGLLIVVTIAIIGAAGATWLARPSSAAWLEPAGLAPTLVLVPANEPAAAATPAATVSAEPAPTTTPSATSSATALPAEPRSPRAPPPTVLRPTPRPAPARPRPRPGERDILGSSE